MAESKVSELLVNKQVLTGDSDKDFGTYRWEQLHQDLEDDKKAGTYGGCHSAYHGLAALRAGVDLKNRHKNRSPDEFYLEDLEYLMKQPSTRANWDRLCTIDPMGLYGKTPTMAATTAVVNLPELHGELTIDGVIVDPIDQSVKISKIAIDYAWNIPMFSQRLGFPEEDVRKALFDYTENPKVLDPELKAFLPPTGGCTVYIIGDVKKIADKSTEITVRVHDACCGSDVFGTDICTCRPYLVFSMQAATECAQRGGVGIIIYYQKEGRSLGEVTKYRVYNARKRQEGGDRPEKYFFQTEAIAGIRDARFQEMMPDILVWLGVTRIDWLCSMSSEKFDAITFAGIKIMQRVALPDMYVPKNAQVEITAKIASGYHSDTVDSNAVLDGLRGLEAIRVQCQRIYELSKEKKSAHFTVDQTKMEGLADFVIDVTKKNYPDLNVPYHARWRHFDEADLTQMVTAWPCDELEKVRRQIDLVTVSVLMDAGAGNSWHYRTRKDKITERSEGLGLASQEMFEDGLFSSDPYCVPHRVNAQGLLNLTEKQLGHALQVSEHNPLVGVTGRHGLLQRLASALKSFPEFFGAEVCRPGNIVDYLLANSTDKKCSLKVLWKAVINGFESIWPKNIAGVRRGDVWVYSSLKITGQPGSDMIPFHKLSQWLTYSMLEPLENMGFIFSDKELMTGLAEYRNGGMFVDADVIVPNNPDVFSMSFDAGSELVVEWRALTICLLDELAVIIRKKLGKTETEFPLAKILEGGTWASGRKLAHQKRPETNAPPIRIRSDGTVF